MTSSDLVNTNESFPVLTGDIVQDTETIVGELAVGAYVVERGMARLYIVWKTKLFLDLTMKRFTCLTCGFVFDANVELDMEYEDCPKCNNDDVIPEDLPLYPTLEAYLSYISDLTGKSRQTLFNRLKAYRVLCDERGVNPEHVFKLMLLSSGAATKLATADDGSDNVALENDSWQDTVERALGTGSKSGALEYVKYDVLRETKITSAFDAAKNTITVFREYNVEEDQFTLEEYKLVLSGEWPEQVLDWLVKRLRAKIN